MNTNRRHQCFTLTLMLSVNSPPGISVVLIVQMILPVSGSTSIA